MKKSMASIEVMILLMKKKKKKKKRERYCMSCVLMCNK
jgi:hypothetical protein